MMENGTSSCFYNLALRRVRINYDYNLNKNGNEFFSFIPFDLVSNST
jgi:hypothetical protein